ncbi:MAG: hypothetical protein JRJ44_05750 [Deltaproteobacteria bacterium]|nr:hypothetical protein [Deltaproteobacteria bacterium]
MDIKLIKEVIKVIGINGFGRDKSTGKGRFEVKEEYKEENIKRLHYDAQKDYKEHIHNERAVPYYIKFKDSEINNG